MPNSSWARAGPFQVSIDFSPEGSDRRRAFYFFKKKNFWTFFLRVRLALSPLSIRLCLSLIFFIDLQGQPTSFPSSLGLQIGLPFHPRQTLEAPLPTNDIPFSPSIIPFSFSLSLLPTTRSDGQRCLAFRILFPPPSSLTPPSALVSSSSSQIERNETLPSVTIVGDSQLDD